MRESEIITELKKGLKELLPVPSLRIAIKSERSKKSDAVAQVDYQGLRFELIIEIVSSGSLAILNSKINRLEAIKASNEQIPVLVAPYLSPERQELCRKNGIFFIDLSGNVYLSYGSFYIEKVGFQNKFPEKRQRRSPFSDKASLILRELLKNGQRRWGIRELAQKIDLNPGYVSRMARALENLKYVSRVAGKLKIRSADEILGDWIRAYEIRNNEMHKFFCMAVNADEILNRLRELHKPSNIKYGLSVQAGASLVAPHAVYKEVHLYVENKKGIEFFGNVMDLKDASEGANMILMLPYYRHSVFYDSREIDGLKVVSDIQLYLDLYGYPVRGREQAEHLYRKRIRKVIGSAKDDE